MTRPTLEIRYIAGQVHATPWNADANEGRVEWPPSPWRIGRALASCYFQKCPELDEDIVRSLLAKLTGSTPRYILPEAVHTHSRHYMPRVDKDFKTTKVFDAFLAVDREDPVVVSWPIELSHEEMSALRRLAGCLSYLGRAESWVLVEVTEQVPEAFNCTTTGDGEASQDVLALVPHEEFSSVVEAEHRMVAARWLAEEREKAREKGREPADTLSSSKRKRLAGYVPDAPFDALCVEVPDLHKLGLSRPFGTRTLRYFRPEPRTTLGSRPVRPAEWTDVLEWRISSNVVPRLERLLHHTSRIHQGVCSKADDAESPLVGKDAAGNPAEGHAHPYFLVQPDSQGRMSSVFVWMRGGIDEEQRKVLMRLERTWAGKDGSEPLEFVLASLRRPATNVGYFGRSTTWRSLTPFVSTRHPKFRGGEPRLDEGLVVELDGAERALHYGSAAHDIVRLFQEEWALRTANGNASGDPKIVSVRTVDFVELGGRKVPWRKFATRRTRGGGSRGPGAGHGFEIELSEPIDGPLVLGYGAHFGLGAFVAV